MKKPKILKNDEAVSPVIGVILMVAITVIMAAIVAGFVFGVISTPEATPTASITVDDYSITDNGYVDLLHQSGESLTQSDLRIVVDGPNSFTFEPDSDSEWQAGTIRTLANDTTIGDFSNSSFNLNEGTYDVRVIHEPSGNAISTITFEAE